MAALRIVVLAAVVGCLLGVSGCPQLENIRIPPMEYREEYVLRPDLSGTFSQQMVFVLDEPLRDEDVEQMESEAAELRAELPPGGTAEKIVKGNRLGIRWTVPFSDLRRLKGELAEIGDGMVTACDLSCKRRGLTLECCGTIPEEAEGFTPYTLKITMPARIRRSNADKTEGRTAIWTSANKRRIEVTCVCPAPWMVAVAGFGIVAIVGCGTAWARRRRGGHAGSEAVQEDG
jgi:hypothetical protein